jgi:hypothetical protein
MPLESDKSPDMPEEASHALGPSWDTFEVAASGPVFVCGPPISYVTLLTSNLLHVPRIHHPSLTKGTPNVRSWKHARTEGWHAFTPPISC